MATFDEIKVEYEDGMSPAIRIGELITMVEELQAQVDELRTKGQTLLDATGHSTWNKLFKAPSVEQAINELKAAIKGDKL